MTARASLPRGRPYFVEVGMTKMFSPIAIVRDPEILGGTPVFAGTRVPVKSLFEYLKKDYTLEQLSRAPSKVACEVRSFHLAGSVPG